MTLGALLAIVTFSHVMQALESSAPTTVAGAVGAVVTYAAITVLVLAGRRLGYTAAVVLPLLSFFYSDHRLVGPPARPIEILYFGLYAAIVPLGAYLWYASGAASARDIN
ncbi:hypothetical protein ACXYTP_21970 [Tsukamurella ocularis]|uniref:hypothetical protein n=1 Tax=Tsukamurella ocularis TaxID=1970234 RepID=UPI0039F07F52